jgi:uncharacterized protein (DUF697 family)
LDQLLIAIAASEPRIVAALGKALPEYRWRLAWRSIISASSLSAVIALIPLPVIDFVPLTVNQTTMVLGIARIYNYKINFQRAKELVVTFGLGFLGRTLFQEISKLGGLPGWLLSAPMANIDAVVDETGIRPYFNAIISAFGQTGKPDPWVFIEAGRQLGANPKTGIVIEDSPAGVLGAHRAGYLCIAVSSSLSLAESKTANLLVNRLDQVKYEDIERILPN